MSFFTTVHPRLATTVAASSHFQAIFHVSLKSYQKQTKNDLITHPLASQLKSCDSPTSAIFAILQDQVGDNHFVNLSSKLTKWLSPILNVLVNVLNAFSASVTAVVDVVSLDGCHSKLLPIILPEKVIIVGIGVLVQAIYLSGWTILTLKVFYVVKDVSESKDVLVELFVTPSSTWNNLKRKRMNPIEKVEGYARTRSVRPFLFAGRTDSHAL